ncbi:MAG: hypothetical protein ACI9KE_004975 [Polyangiales bacterium]|jgi:hypothetical protein
MITVVSCAGCERFVRASDSECPFCGTERNARSLTLRRPHVARVAMVAMALAGGCGGTAPVYGGPPPETAPPSDEESDSTSEDVEAEDEAEEGAEEGIESGAPAPIYGAAPPQE